MPPVVVVEGSDAAFERAIGELRIAGWHVGAGFDGRDGPGAREVRSGRVASSDDASRALLAVLGGAGVVVHGLAPREVLDRLIGDLRHVGPVVHRRGAEPPTVVVHDDAKAILCRLADGQTLGEAADALALSRRTADRRLAEARHALGVERTVEAISMARRLGWLG